MMEMHWPPAGIALCLMMQKSSFSHTTFLVCVRTVWFAIFNIRTLYSNLSGVQHTKAFCDLFIAMLLNLCYLGNLLAEVYSSSKCSYKQEENSDK